MPESMGTPENRFRLYDSEWVKVEPLENPNVKPRPISSAMQAVHPELYDFLIKKQGARKFAVGIIHIDHNKALSNKLKAEGKTQHQIGQILMENFKAGLVDIASKIKSNSSLDLAKLDYLTAASRLFSLAAERLSVTDISRELGFEVFDMDEGQEEIFGRGSRVGLISKEKLLQLYGQKK